LKKLFVHRDPKGVCSRLFKVFIKVNKVLELGSSMEIAIEVTSVLI